jgi:hypothetical protein
VRFTLFDTAVAAVFLVYAAALGAWMWWTVQGPEAVSVEDRPVHTDRTVLGLRFVRHHRHGRDR